MTTNRSSRWSEPLALLGERLLDRYVICERVGGGGMSLVYRADDERLDRAVCIKVFSALDRSAASYSVIYEHFVQEAFALSQLQHPNTLRIYDFGYLDEEPWSPFQVSEYLAGGTLYGRVRRNGPFSLEATLETLAPVCGALQEAHERGIIHRDIKPTNVLYGIVGTKDVVKLVDFGIAQAILDHGPPTLAEPADGDAPSGKKGRIALYSPGWAAPEQLRAQHVGPAADVYGLGLLTAYMLTGSRIFPDDDDQATILALRTEGDEYVEQRLAELDLSPQVRAELLRACRTDPSSRHQSVDEFLSAFRRLVAAPSPAPVSSVYPTPPPESPSGERATVHLSAVADVALLPNGRRVRVVDSGATITPRTASDASIEPRLRITLFASVDGHVRANVKGLNCFVRKPDARAAAAVDLDGDTEVTLLGLERGLWGSVSVSFGMRWGDSRVFHVETTAVTLPADPFHAAALIDFGPDSDAFLVCERASKEGLP